MYLKNLRIYARHLRLDLADHATGLPEPAQRRLLLQGANGSGKTTILEAIATLWDFFGEWIDAGTGRAPPQRCCHHWFANCELVAMELGGLFPDGASLWLGMGKESNWSELRALHPHAKFSGLIQSPNRALHRRWRIELSSYDWTAFRHRSMVGSEPKANIVYFPPHGRAIGSTAGRAPKIVDLTPFTWLARYSDSVFIASLLLTMLAKSPSDYEGTLRLINQALDNQGKAIHDLSTQGMVVRGETSFGKPYEHPIGALSSGEKQMLLLIGFMATTLRDGGIVLIDEPDLHIHVVMIPQLLGSIETIVRERRGQLIVASHSQEVWDWFSLSRERIELAPWRRTAT